MTNPYYKPKAIMTQTQLDKKITNVKSVMFFIDELYKKRIITDNTTIFDKSLLDGIGYEDPYSMEISLVFEDAKRFNMDVCDLFMKAKIIDPVGYCEDMTYIIGHCNQLIKNLDNSNGKNNIRCGNMLQDITSKNNHLKHICKGLPVIGYMIVINNIK